jgi:hypothetical protein
MWSELSDSLTDIFEFKLEREGRYYLPIVYNENYDISFWNLERCHPFDAHKWKKIHNKIDEYFEVYFKFQYKL